MTMDTLTLGSPARPRLSSGLFRRLVTRFLAGVVLLGVYSLGAVGVSGLALTVAGVSSTPADAQRRRRRRRRRGRGRGWEDCVFIGPVWVCE